MTVLSGGRARAPGPGHRAASGKVLASAAAVLEPGKIRARTTATPHTPHQPARLLLWLLGLILLTVSSDCLGRMSHEAKEAELQSLRRQIAALSEHLKQARSTENAVQRELRITETSIGDIANELSDVGRRLAAAQGQLEKLNRERERLATRLAAHRKTLAKQVRAAYITGNQDYLKLLLNQEDPAAVERMLTYYRYFSRARAEQIQRAEAELLRLETVQRDISRQQKLLRSLQDRARERKTAREAQRQERALILKRLQKEIRQGGHELDGLKANEKELERLLKALREAFEDIPRALDRRKSFHQRRGQLLWPAQGKLRHRFGTSRNRGGLKWHGVLINSPTGQPVTAIHHGRVAFADWLRGLGLLIIIDHGNGYMSLYGHNQSLLKEAGDWVETGDSVATIGDSGGLTSPGLYFEIRRHGIPQNPASWCSSG